MYARLLKSTIKTIDRESDQEIEPLLKIKDQLMK